MIKLTRSLEAWKTQDFEAALREEIQNIEPGLLPLQEGLSQSSYVSDADVTALILNAAETKDDILVKVGVFYAGIIAGSCCADDPTPVCEQTEYCELQCVIDKITAETTVSLFED